MSLPSGKRLGPYEIQSALGAGGMGEVYRARDTRLDRTVAIRVLASHHSSDSGSRQRFEREARTISKFSHPNICTLHDVGNHDGLDYLVVEYIEAESLEQRLIKRTSSNRLALAIRARGAKPNANCPYCQRHLHLVESGLIAHVSTAVKFPRHGSASR